MSVIGNILWFIFAGFWQGVSWCLVGLVWCITIVGIPVGTQCFKMAGLAFFPFGKEVEYGGGAGSAILNVLWFVFGGVFLALEALLNGVLLCITVIGIPFGLQCFKQAKLALLPFGAVVRERSAPAHRPRSSSPLAFWHCVFALCRPLPAFFPPASCAAALIPKLSCLHSCRPL